MSNKREIRLEDEAEIIELARKRLQEKGLILTEDGEVMPNDEDIEQTMAEIYSLFNRTYFDLTFNEQLVYDWFRAHERDVHLCIRAFIFRLYILSSFVFVGLNAIYPEQLGNVLFNSALIAVFMTFWGMIEETLYSDFNYFVGQANLLQHKKRLKQDFQDIIDQAGVAEASDFSPKAWRKYMHKQLEQIVLPFEKDEDSGRKSKQ